MAVEHIEGWLHDVSAALEREQREQESINSSRAQQVASPRGGRANSAAEQQQEDEHALQATAARVLSQSQAELLAQQERLQVRATIDRQTCANTKQRICCTCRRDIADRSA